MNLLRCCVAACCVALPTIARAQDSQFSLRGPGTPSRFESAGARATGGAFAPFDALSWMTDAPLGDLRGLTASTLAIASFRDVLLDTMSATTRTTRFPSLLIATPLERTNSPVLAIGFGGYLDRSYRTTVRDSVLINGEMEAYDDAITSDGGMSDIRFAAAWRIRPRISIGAAFHLLSGRTRSSAARRYDDSTVYRGSFEITDVQHTGAGYSGGVIIGLLRGVRVAAWARSDTELKVSVDDRVRAVYDLPTTYGAGLLWSPSAQFRLAGYASSHSWSDGGGNNTLEWAAGAEVFSPLSPLRVGVRGSTMPFAPAGIEPTELAVAAGIGRPFAQGRARMDLTVERMIREGGDLREELWSVLFGFTIQP
jgi:hypothetical protein